MRKDQNAYEAAKRLSNHLPGAPLPLGFFTDIKLVADEYQVLSDKNQVANLHSDKELIQIFVSKYKAGIEELKIDPAAKTVAIAAVGTIEDFIAKV